MELDRRLKTTEQQWAELAQLSAAIEQAMRDEAAIGVQAAAVVQHAAQVGALRPLAAPPLLAPTEPLARVIQSIQESEAEQKLAAARAAAIGELPQPPELFDAPALDKQIEEIAALHGQAQRSSQQRQVFARLPAPPPLVEVGELQRLIDKLTAASTDEAAGQSRCSR